MNTNMLKHHALDPDFNKADRPEPKNAADSDSPIFVIHQHDASTLHFDFRLEIDNRLVSWVIPKGPSTDPEDKRLAIQTEDHPMQYAAFEGLIPEGEYGAGAVIVWDHGRFLNQSEKDGNKRTLQEALEDGHIRVWLEGSKLRGGYSLVHTGFRGEDENWLLIKEDDEAADARRNPVSTEPRSPISDKTLDDVRSALED